MKIRVLGILMLSLCYFIPGSAQSCSGFYKTSRCGFKQSADFKQYGQAKSAAVMVGKEYKYEAVLYGMKDYIVGACTEAGYKKIHLKITDKKTGEVIYDNEEDDYNSNVAFSIETTTNVEIAVEVISERDGSEDPENYRVCLGVQILWRKIPKMGFN
jgi:hypothetical protein